MTKNLCTAAEQHINAPYWLRQVCFTLCIFILKTNFLYLLQQCDPTTFFMYFLAKENPAGVYIVFPGINLGNDCFEHHEPKLRSQLRLHYAC